MTVRSTKPPATGGGTGDVVGPASAVNNRVVMFNGTTGKLVKDNGMTLTGTNTGDQTSIVGITGAKADFNTACTDGDFLYVGDVSSYTDEQAQDAVGAMVDASLTYVDATPLLQRSALTGAITAPAGSNTTSLGSFTKAQLDTAISDGNAVYDLATVHTLTENAGATTPSSGTGAIFIDTSNIMAYKDDNGRYWASSYNASVANQSPATTVTYVTGSDLKIPSWGHQAKTTILWRISASKTAAGVAAPIYNIRWGVNATTADTSHITLTAPAQTAIADIGTLFIELVIRTTGASGTMAATAWWGHRGTAATSTVGTGFANDGTGHVQGTATWDMTGVAGQFVGISVTTGTSAAWTIQQVSATANW
jgi:hypothetical protein